MIRDEILETLNPSERSALHGLVIDAAGYVFNQTTGGWPESRERAWNRYAELINFEQELIRVRRSKGDFS